MDNEKLAKRFCEAIILFTENPENLDNFECYLSQHFDEWLKKHANTPENITFEMCNFACLNVKY